MTSPVLNIDNICFPHHLYDLSIWSCIFLSQLNYKVINIKEKNCKYGDKINGFAAAAKLFQSCPTVCDAIDGSPPGSSVPGILQERILEWVAISFSSACIHGKSRQSCPDSERPYREQPTRLLRPQDSLGKNTGVGEVFAGYSKYQSQFLFTP